MHHFMCVALVGVSGLKWMYYQSLSSRLLTWSKRDFSCSIGTVLWCHIYCAGGLACALHSRNRVSPSDTAWDWGWLVMSSPLADPASRMLLQSRGDRISNDTSRDVRGKKGGMTRDTCRMYDTDVSPLGKDTLYSMVDPTDIVTLVDRS